MKSIETNIRMVGRIHAMPRKIYWIAMPESFKEKEKVELLQQDIWVIPFSIEKIPELEGEANIIIFVDLDKTLFSGRASKVASESAIANSLIENIRTVKPLHIIVHTTHINPALKSIFGQASLTYLEKNLYDTTAALATIIKTVNYLYDKTNSNKRAFLRIELDEKNRIPVKCRIKNNPASLIEGYIGDISMNGLQIVLKNPEI
ncbi:MAG: hypothetical protein OEV66_06390, partial [Spirochaetia bacterium]|nr:hypothetical protein [Spirochaetia bacterium]